MAGRPKLDKKEKRSIKICFYINQDELENLESLKNRLSNSSPALTISEFFRIVLEKHDDTLLDFLSLSPSDEVKNHLRLKRSYNSIFDNKDEE